MWCRNRAGTLHTWWWIDTTPLRVTRQMTRPAAPAPRFVTSAPITSGQMWLIVAWVLLGSELVRQLIGVLGVEGTATKSALQAGFYGVIVLWILWLRRRNGLDVPHLFGPPPTRLSRIVPVLAGPLGALIWMGLYSPLVYGPLLHGGAGTPPVSLESGVDWGHPASALLRLAILIGLGPAVEEILFRGILLNRMTQTLGASAASGLLALLFAAAHVAFLPSLVLAVMVTALYRRTGSLWIAISAHSLNNALVVLWMSGGAWLFSRHGAGLTWAGLLWTARAALLVGVVGLVLIFRSRALRASPAQPRSHDALLIT